VSVLLVSVSVVSLPINVSGPAGRVRVPPEPPKVGVLMVGLVNVLLVNVSVVALPTRVSVEVGNVRVPVLEIVEIIGLVNVLFVYVMVALGPNKVTHAEPLQ
jgi:hypothetical protein